MTAELQKSEIKKTTVIAGLLVVGSHLVSPRTLEVLGTLINRIQPNCAVSLSFRDDKFPMIEGYTVHGVFDVEHLSIQINLERHMDEVRETIVDKNPAVSFRLLYWHALMDTIIHELHHGMKYMAATPEERSTILGTEALDTEAREFSTKLVEDLMLEGINMEPPAIVDDPMLAFELEGINDIFKNGDAEDKEWCQRQLNLVAENVAFEDAAGQKSFTYKAFIRSLSNRKDNPKWDDVVVAHVEVVQPAQTQDVAITSLIEDTSLAEIPARGAGAVIPMSKVPIMDELPMDYDEFDPNQVANMFNSLVGDSIPGQILDLGTKHTMVAPVFKPAEAPVGTYMPPTWANPMRTGMTAPGVAAPGYMAPPVLPTLTIPPEQQKVIAEQVFARLFYQLFSKCGFNPTSQTTFDQPTGVLESAVRIDDIPGAMEIFIAYDCGDQATGLQTALPITNQGIHGFITKDKRLPGFSVWINRGGVKAQLKLLPQNPNSVYTSGELTGQLKKTAVSVRQEGKAIAWIVGETPQGQPSDYLWCFEMAPGGQLTYRWLKGAK